VIYKPRASLLNDCPDHPANAKCCAQPNLYSMDNTPALPTRFNVRAYFILFNELQDAVLVSDELIFGNAYTKFPGGGVDFGEGPSDTVVREAMEEMKQPIEVTGHFYTTDFYLPSFFHPADQIISIYYTARMIGAQQFNDAQIAFDFKQRIYNEESFRWVKLSVIREDMFHFAADKKVAGMLANRKV
jgi:ADP-ribose pyrophosphatase YjhB (NUDIX family)